jgi:hypothetical protein
MSFNNYSPDNIKAVFDGIPILGYAKGTFLQGGRSEATFSMVVGALGDVTRVQSLNKTGSIKFTLMQSSVTLYLAFPAISARLHHLLCSLPTMPLRRPFLIIYHRLSLQTRGEGRSPGTHSPYSPGKSAFGRYSLFQGGVLALSNALRCSHDAVSPTHPSAVTNAQ